MLLSKKLPITIVSISLLSIAIASSAGLYLGSSSLTAAAYDRLSAVVDGRRNELKAYLDRIKFQLRDVAESATTRQALLDFSIAWPMVEGDKGAELQRRYIKDNPHPTGKKQLLESAQIDTYDKMHARHHAFYRYMVDAYGYYDIFLINPEGDVVYSVFKELDYATNLVSGDWASTDLGNVFRETMERADPNAFIFRDYAKYGPSNDAPASFIGKAVSNGHKIIGVLVFKMPSDRIQAIMSNKTGLGQTGEAFIFNKDGYFLSDSPFTDQADALATRFVSPLTEQTSKAEVITGLASGHREGDYKVAMIDIEFLGSTWTLASIISESEALAGLTQMKFWILIASLALSVAIVAFSIWFAGTITAPIDRLVRNMSKLADGNLDFELDSQSRADEIGKMISAVQVFRDAAIEKNSLEANAERTKSEIEENRQRQEAKDRASSEELNNAVALLADGLDQLAEGNLTVQITEPFKDDLDDLRVNFNSSIERLRQTLLSITDDTVSINESSGEIRNSADDLSRRTELQAATLEETTNALTEFKATVNTTSDSANEASEMTKLAAVDAEKSSEVVENAVKAMQSIETASSEITTIITVIDEIAFQTNLLALNAGVEAARAGEAGSGFAVVAQEVRGLAQRSAEAAQDIKALISKSNNEVKSGVGLVNEAGNALEAIAEHVASINGKISSIAESSNQQMVSIQGLYQAVSEMDAGTQQNAALSEESNAMSQKLASDVSNLLQRISEFETNSSEANWAENKSKAA